MQYCPWSLTSRLVYFKGADRKQESIEESLIETSSVILTLRYSYYYF